MSKKVYIAPEISEIKFGIPSKSLGISPSVRVIKNIDGEDVKSLVKKYGSPLYVYSATEIRRRAEDEKRAFSTRWSSFRPAWSYKTCYAEQVCREYIRSGYLSEVVSGEEMDIAFRLGVEGRDIIFNGPDKRTEDIERAVSHGVLINADSFAEVVRIESAAISKGVKARIGIRLRLEIKGVLKWDRFGMSVEDGSAMRAAEYISQSENLSLESLHTHIGTFIVNADAFRLSAAQMSQFAVDVYDQCGVAVKIIDVGGGFATGKKLRGCMVCNCGVDDYARAVTDGLRSVRFPFDVPSLVVESGRALVDSAGYLVATVIGERRCDTPPANRQVTLDAGVNLLFTSLWYENEVCPYSLAESSPLHLTRVVGPLCMNIDVISQSVLLPRLRTGDIVTIPDTGAYNYTQSMQFIRRRPAAVFVCNKNVEVIREAETGLG